MYISPSRQMTMELNCIMVYRKSIGVRLIDFLPGNSVVKIFLQFPGHPRKKAQGARHNDLEGCI